LGVTIYAVLFTSAPLIAQFFHSPGFVPVLRLVGVQVIILSLSSVQQALLVRDMGFQKLFGVKLVTALVPGFFSIPMALKGFGVWALVAGTLIGSILNLVLLWSRSTWRPKWVFSMALARQLFSFGIWVVGESLVGWFMLYGDNLIVGRVLGTWALGIYAVAWNMCTIIYGLLLNPFLPVLYSAFSRIQDDRKALITSFKRVIQTVMLISLPVGVGFLLVAPQFVIIFFGEKWQGLGLVLSLIGFLNGISWITSINSEVYRSIGRPDINTKFLFILLAYYLPTLIVAASFGLEIFSFARLTMAIIALPISVFFMVRFLGFSPFYLWSEGKSIILSVSLMAVSICILQWLFVLLINQVPLIMKLLIEILTGGIVYFLTLWLCDKEFVNRTIKLAKQAIL
jgi:PST family polysaccharide transporter